MNIVNKNLIRLLAAFVPVAAPAAASDTDDIVALLAEVHNAYLDCDAGKLQELAHPDWFGAFDAGGEFSTSVVHKQIREQCAEGYRLDYQYEILKMEVHGNWAFVAGRAHSDLMAPDGEVSSSDLRMSWVLNRHQGAWKRYFVHVASVEPAAGPSE
ncbi:MAG: nuclear transport factor 2 family protein [Alphaproteobacteria bacterium]